MGLLAAAAQDKGIAALEPHYRLAGGGPFRQEFIDLRLGQSLAAAFLAHKDALGAGRSRVQQGRIQQAVIDHHLGLLQAVQTLDGDKAGVAGAGAHQKNFAWHSVSPAFY